MRLSGMTTEHHGRERATGNPARCLVGGFCMLLLASCGTPEPAATGSPATAQATAPAANDGASAATVAVPTTVPAAADVQPDTNFTNARPGSATPSPTPVALRVPEPAAQRPAEPQPMPDNEPPRATSMQRFIGAGESLLFRVSVEDADGDAVALRVLEWPEHGTLVQAATPLSFRYEPAPGFTGIDRVTLVPNDGYTDGAVAEVSVHVRNNVDTYEPSDDVIDVPMDSRADLDFYRTRDDYATEAAYERGYADGRRQSPDVRIIVLQQPRYGQLVYGTGYHYVPYRGFIGDDYAIYCIERNGFRSPPARWDFRVGRPRGGYARGDRWRDRDHDDWHDGDDRDDGHGRGRRDGRGRDYAGGGRLPTDGRNDGRTPDAALPNPPAQHVVDSALPGGGVQPIAAEGGTPGIRYEHGPQTNSEGAAPNHETDSAGMAPVAGDAPLGAHPSGAVAADTAGEATSGAAQDAIAGAAQSGVVEAVASAVETVGERAEGAQAPEAAVTADAVAAEAAAAEASARANAEQQAAERQAETAAAEQQAAERAEAERALAERQAAERAAAERAEAERAFAEREAAERAAAAQAAAAQAAAEQAAAEQAAAEQAAAEKAASERAAAERERAVAERRAREAAAAADAEADARRRREEAEQAAADAANAAFSSPGYAPSAGDGEGGGGQ